MPSSPAISKKGGVLFLSHVINCNDGIAAYCETLASGLKTKGIDVHLVCGDVRYDENSQRKRDMLEASVTSWQVLPDLRTIPPPSTIMKLRRIVRDNGIQAINVHGLGMLLLGRILSMLTGLPLIGTYHQSILGSLQDVMQNSKNKFGLHQEFFLNLAYPKALIVLSEESLTFLRSHRILFRNRVLKVLGGTDIVHFRPPSTEERKAARERFSLAPDDYACILVARLAWVKGHDILVKAARQLRATHPDLSIKCLFVGSGGKDRETEIRTFSHQDEADKDTFRFVGFMSDVREALWAADVFVLPSRFEGFALGVVEAMACGLVPVRTPSGGAVDQIIDGETGLLVPFEDVDGLARVLLRLSDPQLRQEMSTKSIDRARRCFGVEPMVDAMLPIYGLSRR